jgi:glycosyl transferase family 25
MGDDPPVSRISQVDDPVNRISRDGNLTVSRNSGFDISSFPLLSISLNSSSPRSQASIKSLTDYGFTNIITFPGVNVKNITEEELNKLTSLRTRKELIHGRYVHEAISSKGALGCYLAHLNVWKKCVELDKIIIVAEDDAIMKDDTSMAELQKAYTDAVNNNFDILMCHKHYIPGIPSNQKRITNNIYCIDETISCMFYFITPAGAKVLIKNALPIEVHVDHYINLYAILHPNFHKYYTTENFVEEYGGSEIGHNSIKYYEDYHCLKKTYEYPNILILISVLIFIIFSLICLYQIL